MPPLHSASVPTRVPSTSRIASLKNAGGCWAQTRSRVLLKASISWTVTDLQNVPAHGFAAEFALFFQIVCSYERQYWIADPGFQALCTSIQRAACPGFTEPRGCQGNQLLAIKPVALSVTVQLGRRRRAR